MLSEVCNCFQLLRDLPYKKNVSQLYQEHLWKTRILLDTEPWKLSDRLITSLAIWWLRSTNNISVWADSPPNCSFPGLFSPVIGCLKGCSRSECLRCFCSHGDKFQIRGAQVRVELLECKSGISQSCPGDKTCHKKLAITARMKALCDHSNWSAAVYSEELEPETHQGIWSNIPLRQGQKYWNGIKPLAPLFISNPLMERV